MPKRGSEAAGLDKELAPSCADIQDVPLAARLAALKRMKARKVQAVAEDSEEDVPLAARLAKRRGTARAIVVKPEEAARKKSEERKDDNKRNKEDKKPKTRTSASRAPPRPARVLAHDAAALAPDQQSDSAPPPSPTPPPPPATCPAPFGEYIFNNPAIPRELIPLGDAELYGIIFTLNRACRDWVLGTAPTMRLSIDATEAQPDDDWEDELASLRRALKKRGTLPTHMSIRLENTRGTKAVGSMLLSRLRGAAGGVVELTITVPAGGAACDARKVPLSCFVEDMGATFTGIRKLTLPAGTPFELPKPTILPHLRELTINAKYGGLGPYMPQLTSLTINVDERYHHRYDWDWLPGNVKTSKTLTSFSTDGWMTGSLLNILLGCAPNLEDLCVGGWYLGCGKADSRWKVKKLTFNKSVTRDNILSLLPRTLGVEAGDPGRTEITDCADSFALRGELLHQPSFTQRMSEWSFNAEVVFVSYSAQHNSDIPRTLQQLQTHLHAPGAIVILRYWPWDEARAELLATFLASKETNMKIGVQFPGPMTDSTLQLAMQMGPELHAVMVDQVSLQSSLYVDMPVPWKELSLRTLDLADIVRMPHIDATCKLRVGKLTITPSGLTQIGVDRASACLKRLPLTPLSDDPTVRVTVQLVHNTGPANLPLLRDMAYLLKSITFSRPASEPSGELKLIRWSRYGILNALAGSLPEWAREWTEDMNE